MTENPPPSNPRALLRALFDEAVRVAHPMACVPQHLPVLAPGTRLLILGAGKADAAMAQAVEAHYSHLGQLELLHGFVTTRTGFSLPTQRIEILEAPHPTPGDASQHAAARTLAAVRAAEAGSQILILLSGGASSLWSAPAIGLSGADKATLTQQLLKSGAPIGAMNTVRRHLSAIKGGRLAAAAAHVRLLTLAISDVPHDVPHDIGSGPTIGDPTTLTDAQRMLAHYRITPGEPIVRALSDPRNESIKPGAAELQNSRFVVVARPKASLDAAAVLARQAGYRIEILGDSVEGEARDVGRQHAALALSAYQRGERTAILSGGECTVTVADSSTGSGGPNQEYALGLALGLDGAGGICALACDTDGIDGGSGAATDPAGAIVMPDTLARARLRHIEAADMLANNDSTSFFRDLGDLVACGPTQTNVNDFRVILVDPN